VRSGEEDSEWEEEKCSQLSFLVLGASSARDFEEVNCGTSSTQRSTACQCSPQISQHLKFFEEICGKKLPKLSFAEVSRAGPAQLPWSKRRGMLPQWQMQSTHLHTPRSCAQHTKSAVPVGCKVLNFNMRPQCPVACPLREQAPTNRKCCSCQPALQTLTMGVELATPPSGAPQQPLQQQKCFLVLCSLSRDNTRMTIHGQPQEAT